jgi:hypothetical protein
LYKFLKKKLNQSGEVLSKEQELRFKLMSEGFGGPVAASEFLGGSGFGSAW